MPRNKGPPRKGADDAAGAPKGGSFPAWRRTVHQRAKYSSTLKNVRVRIGGGRGGVGCDAGRDVIGGGGGGQPNLSVIIQAAVGASVTFTMEGVEDVMKASLEARITAADSVKGISSVMSLHLRHI